MTALRLRRSATGPLAVLIALPLAACGSGSSSSGGSTEAGVAAAGPADAQTITVDSTDDLDFVPEVIEAKVGTLTITLGNSGQVSHNLVFDDPARPAIGTVTGGKSLSATYTFDTPGTYTFVCTFHNGMDGKVVVS